MNRRELLRALGVGAVSVAGLALVPDIGHISANISAKPRDWRRAKAHRVWLRTRPLPDSWPMRELSQWSIEPDGLPFRHDIAYRNRVTGKEQQPGIDFMYHPSMDIEAELVRQRVMSRSMFGRMIQKECGLNMIDRNLGYFNIYKNPLPVGLCQHARWV